MKSYDTRMKSGGAVFETMVPETDCSLSGPWSLDSHRYDSWPPKPSCPAFSMPTVL